MYNVCIWFSAPLEWPTKRPAKKDCLTTQKSTYATIRITSMTAKAWAKRWWVSSAPLQKNCLPMLWPADFCHSLVSHCLEMMHHTSCALMICRGSNFAEIIPLSILNSWLVSTSANLFHHTLVPLLFKLPFLLSFGLSIKLWITLKYVPYGVLRFHKSLWFLVT